MTMQCQFKLVITYGLLLGIIAHATEAATILDDLFSKKRSQCPHANLTKTYFSDDLKVTHHPASITCNNFEVSPTQYRMSCCVQMECLRRR
mmetsp:Transcript_18803/g.34940  ORF Transcript_18803/g.34940 Transcript_18803/m.34940 type:complete len:91 (-) Transcript_18803:783-1055(-)